MKAVLRTNIKLSGNLKLTIGHPNNTMILSTLDTNTHSIVVPATTDYATDVATLVKKLPTFTVYALPGVESELPTTPESSGNLVGAYGCTRNLDHHIKDGLKILAPLWIEDTIPEYFLIYRCTKMEEDLYSVIQNSILIDQYPIRTGRIGEYLNKIVSNPDRTTLPLHINIDTNTITYCGIDVHSGVYTTKSEPIPPTTGIVTLDDEHYSTGFERLGLICTNLINLEFGVTDTTGDKGNWTYYGVYANTIPTETPVISVEDTLTINSIPHVPGLIPSNVPNLSVIELQDSVPTPMGITMIKDEKGMVHQYSSISNTKLEVFPPVDILPIPGNRIPVSYSPAMGQHGSITITGEIEYGDRIYIKRDGNVIVDVVADDLPLIDSHKPGTNTGNIFNHTGTKQEILSAIASAIRVTLPPEEFLSVVVLPDKIIIKEDYHSNTEWTIRTTTTAISITPIEGGGKDDSSRITVPVEYSSHMDSTKYLPITGGWTSISSTVPSVDGITIVNGIATKISRELDTTYGGVPGYKIKTVYPMCTPYSIPQLTVVSMQFLDVVDFGYYPTEDTINTSTEFLQYYTGTTILPGAQYIVEGNGKEIVNYAGIEYYTQDIIRGEEGHTTYTVVNGNPVVTPLYKYMDPEVSKFSGLSKISSPAHTVPEILYSEYSILQETRLESLLYKNKVYPYITRWEIDGTPTATGTIPRINVNPVFGHSGGIPSTTVSTPTPSMHTHEWYGIGNTAHVGHSYYNRKFSVLDYCRIPGYYSDYYNSNPTSVGYSIISDTGVVTYKGISLQLSPKYAGYKFSVLLQVNNTMSDPIRYTTMVHQDDRSIMVLVEVILEDYKVEHTGLCYSVLYMLSSLKSLDEKSLTVRYGKKLPKLNTGVVKFTDNGELHGVELHNTITGINSNTGKLEFSYPLYIQDVVLENDNKDWGTLIGYSPDGTVVSTNDNTSKGEQYSITSPNGISYPMITVVEKTGIISRDYGNKHLYHISDYSFPVLKLVTLSELNKTTNLTELRWMQVGGGKGYYTKIIEMLSASHILKVLSSNIEHTYSRWYTISDGDATPSDPITVSILPPQSINSTNTHSIELIPTEVPELSTTILVPTVVTTPTTITLRRTSGWGRPQFIPVVQWTIPDTHLTWEDYKWEDGKYRVPSWTGLLSSWESLLCTTTGSIPTGVNVTPILEWRKKNKTLYLLSSRIYPEIREYSLENSIVNPMTTEVMVENKNYFNSSWYNVPTTIAIGLQDVESSIKSTIDTITITLNYLEAIKRHTAIQDKDILSSILSQYAIIPVVYGRSSSDTVLVRDMDLGEVISAGYSEYKIHTQNSTSIGKMEFSIKSTTNLAVYTILKLHKK